jgi:hypothetical protein
VPKHLKELPVDEAAALRHCFSSNLACVLLHGGGYISTNDPQASIKTPKEHEHQTGLAKIGVLQFIDKGKWACLIASQKNFDPPQWLFDGWQTNHAGTMERVQSVQPIRPKAAQLFFCKNFQTIPSGWKFQSFRLR